MTPFGTSATCRGARPTSAIGPDPTNADIGIGPLLTDAVEKVSEKALWNWNLKQTNRGGQTFLNQDCALVMIVESMLLRFFRKILFRQHRPNSDIGRTQGAIWDIYLGSF
jgi:hypothetical protein